MLSFTLAYSSGRCRRAVLTVSRHCCTLSAKSMCQKGRVQPVVEWSEICLNCPNYTGVCWSTMPACVSSLEVVSPTSFSGPCSDLQSTATEQHDRHVPWSHDGGDPSAAILTSTLATSSTCGSVGKIPKEGDRSIVDHTVV